MSSRYDGTLAIYQRFEVIAYRKLGSYFWEQEASSYAEGYGYRCTEVATLPDAKLKFVFQLVTR